MLRKLYHFLFQVDLNPPAPALAEGGTATPAGLRLKRDLVWLLLLCYLLLIHSATLPLFADGIAHTFWEKEHLRTEHALEGDHHVNKQITRTEAQTPKSKSGNIKLSSDDIVHLVQQAQNSLRQPSYDFINSSLADVILHPYYVVLYSSDPPPEA